MEQPIHGFADLFAQLGLPADDAGIRQFIATHSPLPGQVLLADAPFWSDAQARMLRETIADDTDWADVVDRLDSVLRKA